MRRLELLSQLRSVLRANVDPERMLRGVAALLAVEVGQYCIADIVDERARVRRLDIEHADASRRAKLRVACGDAVLPPGGRISKLLARHGSVELVSNVSEAARARVLSDVQLLEGERVRSYMAAVVSVDGAPMGVLTLVATTGNRRYDGDDAEFLAEVADWTGLGLENALRRQLQPRKSVAPPPMDEEEAPPASRRSSRAPR